MKRLFISFFLWMILISAINAKNLVYVVVEGMSRSTFYPLLQRGELPNYQLLAKRGNFRNLGMQADQLQQDKATQLVYGGQETLGIDAVEFIKHINRENPDLAIKCFFSAPINKDYSSTMDVYVNHLIKVTQSSPLKYRKSLDIASDAVTFIKGQQQPFFIMINFTNVDYFARRYREGADIYSKAIQRTDKALGMVINALKETSQFDSTDFVLTTNYGYVKKTQDRVAESWVLSTKKALRKGNLGDLFPSLLDVLDIQDGHLDKMFQGTTLFK